MPYTVDLKPRARKQYMTWKKHVPWAADKIDGLIEAINADPYHGVGRPSRCTATCAAS